VLGQRRTHRYECRHVYSDGESGNTDCIYGIFYDFAMESGGEDIASPSVRFKRRQGREECNESGSDGAVRTLFLYDQKWRRFMANSTRSF
jgi:hypothetical protein